MELPFDLSLADYAMAPANLDTATTLALGHRLLSVVPAELPAHAVANRNLLDTTITLLEKTYGLAQADTVAPLKRPIDLRADGSWGTVKSRIDHWTVLEDGDHPDVLPARELSRKLFPGDSMSFLTLDYNAQWAEANWRIEMLKREQQLPLLRRLIDDFFVDQLLLWHQRYSAMLGIRDSDAPRPAAKSPKAGKRTATAAPDSRPDEAPALAESVSLRQLRRRAQQAIVAWQLTLVTLHLGGHKGARAALVPSDEFRERALAAVRSAAAPGRSEAPQPATPTAPAAADNNAAAADPA